MKMEKVIVLCLMVVLLFVGCAHPHADNSGATAPVIDTTPVETENVGKVDVGQPNDARMIGPLPDTTMENLSDAILSVSLDGSSVYVDDDGHTKMVLQIYTYDQYDMVDIAGLKVGDVFVRYSGEVEVSSIERTESGRICINGGLENNGFDLTTDDSGIFYEIGFNDTKNWYRIGETTIAISPDFRGTDRADLDLGEVTIDPEDFLNGAVTNYDFTPYNTTVRVENGQIVELNRAFMP